MQLERFKKLWPSLYLLFLAIFLSDLFILISRYYLITDPIPLPYRSNYLSFLTKSDGFSFLTSKNIFSPDGSIPLSLFDSKGNLGQMEKQEDNVPVPSSLPIDLIGTIVFSNPKKSIANVELKTKNISLAVRVGNTIDKIAKLENVERGKIFIRNLSNNRLEFIELKDASKISFKSATFSNSQNVDVKQLSPNQFELNRSDVNQAIQNISDLLQQAATIPERGSGGEIIGFRILGIQPNSIFTKLGLQVGDVIKGVNGEKIDSPAKALELFHALKDSSDIKLNFERNGIESDFEYKIK